MACILPSKARDSRYRIVDPALVKPNVRLPAFKSDGHEHTLISGGGVHPLRLVFNLVMVRPTPGQNQLCIAETKCKLIAVTDRLPYMVMILW